MPKKKKNNNKEEQKEQETVPELTTYKCSACAYTSPPSTEVVTSCARCRWNQARVERNRNLYDDD